MESVVVVMPFSEKWSPAVWEALIAVGPRDIQRRIDVIRVDMKPGSEEWLSSHIESINKNAQVIIADLTGQNPNVLIEVGLALAVEKPMLLITQDRRWIPAHLRGRLVEEYDIADPESLERLTVTLYLRIAETLKLLETQRVQQYSKDQYWVECFSERRQVNLGVYFRKATVRIDILTTNLSFLFKADGRRRAPFEDIQASLDRKRSNVKIRILTLDPESDFAVRRGRQLGYAPRLFRDNLRTSLEETLSVASRYKIERFEVRTYDDFPNQIMYRIDDNIFHCVVAQPTQSRRHLTFKLDRYQQGVDRSFTEHFQYIWSRAS